MNGEKAPFPERIKPMLAKLATQVSKDGVYVHEVKWDGYRVMVYLKGGKVALLSREFENFMSKYSPVANALEEIEHDVVLDGEIIVENAEGKPPGTLGNEYFKAPFCGFF
jgi:bifunctional non-homologous end joining protein LigD